MSRMRMMPDIGTESRYEAICDLEIADCRVQSVDSRANATVERRGRKGRKERQDFFAAFAAFAFHGGSHEHAFQTMALTRSMTLASTAGARPAGRLLM